MESQKIINFLEPDDDNDKHFQTKKWYIINDQSNGQYQENSTIKCNTEVINPDLCDYGDAYILVTGDIEIVGGNNNMRFCFKKSPFTRSVVHTHIETAENIQLIMNHYDLVEYSDNYQDTAGSLYHFKRDEPSLNSSDIVNVTTDNSSSFKYKSSLLTALTTEDGGAGANAYRTYKNAQILLSLKYIPSFFRCLEFPFINTKLHLELSWIKNCIMSNVGANDNDDNDTNTFQITKTELYVPVVTLKTNDNLKLTKLLSKGFKRSVFWNEYKSKIETHTADHNNFKIIFTRCIFSRSKQIICFGL